MTYLRVETRDGIQRIPLDQDLLRIGRLSTNDVILPYRQISREHATVERAGGVWWISDLESTNGLQVGGRRVDRYPLQPGERVYLAADITVSLAADDDDFAALATMQMGAASGVPGGNLATGDPIGPAGQRSAPPLIMHLGGDAPAAPLALPVYPMDDVRPALPGDPRRAAQRAGRHRDEEEPASRSGANWRPSSRAAAWRGQRDATTPVANGSGAGGQPEGDLFRRSRAPTRGDGANGARDGTSPRGAMALHVCQTCGQLTPADGIVCQFCRNPLAEPCPRCGMSLLPVQDHCPRCQTPNPAVRGRGRHTADR